MNQLAPAFVLAWALIAFHASLCSLSPPHIKNFMGAVVFDGSAAVLLYCELLLLLHLRYTIWLVLPLIVVSPCVLIPAARLVDANGPRFVGMVTMYEAMLTGPVLTFIATGTTSPVKRIFSILAAWLTNCTHANIPKPAIHNVWVKFLCAEPSSTSEPTATNTVQHESAVATDPKLDRDAHDPVIIAAERDRIRGTAVPVEELSDQLVASMRSRSLSADDRTQTFCTTQYPHAQVLSGGPGSSLVLRLLSGSIDTYITLLFGHPDVFHRSGVRHFFDQTRLHLIGRFKRAQLLLPRDGHEELFWEDAVSLLEKPELDRSRRHVWAKDKCYVILTNVHPVQFNYGCFPLISIDITAILPSEVLDLVISIGRLCGRSRTFSFGMGQGFGRDLFAQDLSRLPGADVSPKIRMNSGLDILSLPVVVIPSISIDFKYFKDEIRPRFESLCEETLSSLPGALPLRAVLEQRQHLRRDSRVGVAMLPEEQSIREFWT